eukprot:11967185-Karenia_brevis.AAC.1
MPVPRRPPSCPPPSCLLIKAMEPAHRARAEPAVVRPAETKQVAKPASLKLLMPKQAGLRAAETNQEPPSLRILHFYYQDILYWSPRPQ